jgi:hypothetical protein
MQEEFTVDGVFYVVRFTEHNEFYFFADVRKSTKLVYSPTTLNNGFWDEPPERIWATTNTGNVFKVKKVVFEFLDNVLRRYSPYFFTLRVIEAKRLSLYTNLARRIGQKYKYSVTWHAPSFRFYLLVD